MHENSSLQKKHVKKALIPLPPTGFTSLFCAKAGGMQMMVPPKPAEGVVGCFAIARSARFCKKVQRLCTAEWDRLNLTSEVRRPVYRGYGCKNQLQTRFSFSERFTPGANH